jgi:hypothetical protein
VVGKNNWQSIAHVISTVIFISEKTKQKTEQT